MNKRLILGILIMAIDLSACGTPQSGFRVVQRSDGMIGVQAVKGAKEIEAQELATKECKKIGKSVARIVEARTTHNDKFPMIYIYQCLN
jgi:tRNA A-37 threonylcarbamoyl transferase component Bud32